MDTVALEPKASAEREVDIDALSNLVEPYLRRKYVTRADERQKALGLSYIEAETRDLAKTFANLVKILIEQGVLELAE